MCSKRYRPPLSNPPGRALCLLSLLRVLLRFAKGCFWKLFCVSVEKKFWGCVYVGQGRCRYVDVCFSSWMCRYHLWNRWCCRLYQKVASRISLGDDKSRVLSILEPIQRDLSASAKKQSESFMKDGKRIDIYYMRSGRQPDGLTTDDEFTPYVFENGVLVAIGWASLGGPKSQGQTSDSIYINNSTTVY